MSKSLVSLVGSRQQFLPDDPHILRRLRPYAHLAAFDGQHRDFDPLAGWRFDNDAFAYAAGEYEHAASLPEFSPAGVSDDTRRQTFSDYFQISPDLNL